MKRFFSTWKRAPVFIISFLAVSFFAVSGMAADVASKTAGESQKTMPTFMLAMEDAMNKVYSVIESIEKEEGLSAKEKMQKFIEFCKVVRYGPEKMDYFQIFDTQGRSVMDPYAPENVGKDFSNFKDRNGTQFFTEMLKTIRKTGQGFTEYLWSLYGGTQVPVTSLARVYHPWDFIVVTSIGKDLIEAYEIPEATLRYVGVAGRVLGGREASPPPQQ